MKKVQFRLSIKSYLLFNMGSSPTDWTTEPPSLEQLRTYLEEQPDRIIKTFSGRLSEVGEKPFTLGPDTTFTRLDEVLLFSIWHEGLHQGAINSMKRALGVEDLWAVVNR